LLQLTFHKSPATLIRDAILLFIVVVASFLLFQAASVSAQDIENNLCAGANLNVNTNCSTPIDNQSPEQRINDIIADIINIFSLIVGITAVIMIIIGGFRYITSGGDSNNVTGAKNTILYAIIGLVIVAMAQFIVRFVLARVTG
jgi:hypothetical protein